MLYGVDEQDLIEADDPIIIVHGTADELVGSQAKSKGQAFTDIIGGMRVSKSSPGQHDGKPATTLTLVGEDSGLELGRMTIINNLPELDALTWKRVFKDMADLLEFEKFVQEIGKIPSGFEKAKARTLDEGDVLWVDNAAVNVQEGPEFVTGGDGTIRIRIEIENPELFDPELVPGEDGELEVPHSVEHWLLPDELVYVKFA